MLRLLLAGIVSACAMIFAGTAGAGVTVDLIWFDTGTATLSIAPGDPGGNSNCSGAFNTFVDTRCLKVVWTVDEPVYIGSNSISWDTSSGITGEFASFFIAYNAIPVGKSAKFLGFPSSDVSVDNISGIAGLFTGATNIIPADGTSGLMPGTYVVGTLVIDASNAVLGQNEIMSIIQEGLDGFVDAANGTITDVVLNSAFIAPEPSTALLLCGGLLALGLRRRHTRR